MRVAADAIQLARPRAPAARARDSARCRDTARVRRQQPQDRQQQLRLAGAGLADDAEAFAGRERPGIDVRDAPWRRRASPDSSTCRSADLQQRRCGRRGAVMSGASAIARVERVAQPVAQEVEAVEMRARQGRRTRAAGAGAPASPRRRPPPARRARPAATARPGRGSDRKASNRITAGIGQRGVDDHDARAGSARCGGSDHARRAHARDARGLDEFAALQRQRLRRARCARCRARTPRRSPRRAATARGRTAPSARSRTARTAPSRARRPRASSTRRRGRRRSRRSLPQSTPMSTLTRLRREAHGSEMRQPHSTRTSRSRPSGSVPSEVAAGEHRRLRDSSSKCGVK